MNEGSSNNNQLGNNEDNRFVSFSNGVDNLSFVNNNVINNQDNNLQDNPFGNSVNTVPQSNLNQVNQVNPFNQMSQVGQVNQVNQQFNQVNPQTNIYNQQISVNSQQPINNGNGGYFGVGNGIKPPEGKSVSSWLFVVITIVFIIIGVLTYYQSNSESKLVCTQENSAGNISYGYNIEYRFKNEILREENIEFKAELGQYYDLYVNDYVELAEKSFKSYEDNNYDIKYEKNKPIFRVVLHGSGRDMMNIYNMNNFTDVSYESVKSSREESGFTCK